LKSPKTVLAVGVTVMVALAAAALGVSHFAAPNKPLVPAEPRPLESGGTIAKLELTPGVLYATSFPDVSGKAQNLGQWQRDLLVINFWATWCAPCKEEMPLLADLQQKYAKNGVQFVGVAADSSVNVANFAQKIPLGYPLLPDESRAIEFSKRLGNRLGLLPHTVVVTPGGEVVYSKLGVVKEAEFEAILQQFMPKK
jgi:thiol-disulfide isomerase/thioredoxin